MKERTRIFSSQENDENFSLNVSGIDTMAMMNINNDGLLDPIDFVENFRVTSSSSKKEAYGLSKQEPITQVSKPFWVATSVVHEVSVLVNAAAAITTVAAAGTVVVAALAVGVLVAGEEKDEAKVYQNINSDFLNNLSKNAFKVGGASYLKKIVSAFLYQVNSYNNLGTVHE